MSAARSGELAVCVKWQLTTVRVEARVSEYEQALQFVLADLPQRQASQSAFPALERFSRVMLDLVPQPMCVLDSIGTIVTVNQAWSDFGSNNNGSADDFLGVNYLAVCDCASGADSQEARPVADGIRRVMRGEALNFSMEYPCHSPTAERWFVCRVQRIQDDSGHLVAVHEDVTPYKKAQQAAEASNAHLVRVNAELARSNADLEQFAYAASHDLIEPLRAVASSVQLLQRRYQGQLDGRADTLIALAVSGAMRMKTLIEDLLAFSRIAKHANQAEEISMETALAEVIANLQEAIVESNVQITYEPLPSVQAQSGQMTQLLQNLLANAIKFRGDKPAVVHVAVRQTGDEWVFSVADQGIALYEPGPFIL